MAPEYCEVVITADDAEWLESFTRALVEDRLAACGQIVPGIRSTYRWKGAVEAATESRVALHTRAELVPAIVERTQRAHPYEVACVIALPIRAASPDYLVWIEQETTSLPTGSV